MTGLMAKDRDVEKNVQSLFQYYSISSNCSTQLRGQGPRFFEFERNQPRATFLQSSLGATGSASSAPLRSLCATVELPGPREPVLLEPLFGTLFVSLESSALRVHSLEVQHANIF